MSSSRLPATAAIITKIIPTRRVIAPAAAATLTTTTTTGTAATAAWATATAAVSTTTAGPTPTTAAATWALITWSGFVHPEAAAINFFSVHGFNGGVGVCCWHFDKAKTPKTARITVRYHGDRLYCSELFKQVPHLFFCRIKRQIPYVYFLRQMDTLSKG